MRNARESLVQNFMSVLTPGESFSLFSSRGEFLAGATWQGGRMGPAGAPEVMAQACRSVIRAAGIGMGQTSSLCIWSRSAHPRDS